MGDHPLECLPVTLHLVAIDLHLEETRERRIVGSAGLGNLRGPRDRVHLEPLQRLFGVEQVLVRPRQLLVQNLRQLRELLPPQLRRDLYKALGDRVDGRGDPHGVRTLQMHPHEGAPGIGRDLERVTQRSRGVTHRRHREFHGTAGGERAGGRCPGEAQTGADRVPYGAVLHLDALVGRQREGPSAPIDREAIHSRSILVRHPELVEQRGILPRLGRQEQALVTHHLIEHAIGLEQVEPGLGLERLPRANRAAIHAATLIGLIDPQRRLNHVLRLDEAGRRQTADRSHDGHHRDQPLEAPDGAQHTAPVDAGLRLGVSLAESHVGAHGRRGRGGHGGQRGAGMKGKGTGAHRNAYLHCCGGLRRVARRRAFPVASPIPRGTEPTLSPCRKSVHRIPTADAPWCGRDSS